MKNLKLTMLLLTLGFINPVSASFNSPLANIIGPLTTLKSQSEKIAALDVVGNHRYYLKYSNKRINSKKNREELDDKTTEIPISCSAKKTVKETC